jgi:hypothetical protein
MKEKAAVFLGGVCVGAALTYFFDPDMGKRRVSRVRDKAVHFKNRGFRIVQSQSRDVKNRLYGLYRETKSFIGNACEPIRGITRRAS